MYIYIYIFSRQGKRLCAFYELSLSIGKMVPARFSCLYEVTMNSPRRRTYHVITIKRAMGRTVKGEYHGQQLGIANCRRD